MHHYLRGNISVTCFFKFKICNLLSDITVSTELSFNILWTIYTLNLLLRCSQTVGHRVWYFMSMSMVSFIISILILYNNWICSFLQQQACTILSLHTVWLPDSVISCTQISSSFVNYCAPCFHCAHWWFFQCFA